MNRSAKSNKSSRPKQRPQSIAGFFLDKGVRETIESILVAIMLALLFRTFEAEAFVIPTGSMAPTLMGRHKDVQCDECGLWYRTGASSENPDRIQTPEGGIVMESSCPVCHYPMLLDPESEPNERSFSGDRILVDKLAYTFQSPDRWDVIVFKYPGNAKQNYIKRLIGLPSEEIKIQQGDIYAAPVGTDEFVIQTKPHRKLQAMLQLVDDTHFIPKRLKDLGWPSRWDEWSATEEQAKRWQIDSSGESPSFRIDGSKEELSWLRYRHLAPTSYDWEFFMVNESLPPWVSESNGTLITDSYAYNDHVFVRPDDIRRYVRGREELQDALANADETIRKLEQASPSSETYNQLRQFQDEIENHLSNRIRRMGMHWVGDLAVEFEVQIEKSGGQLVLDLVEGGVHFECAIDLGNGTAVLKSSDPEVKFLSPKGERIESITGSTKLSSSGKFKIRYANADNRIYLWVNNKPVSFNATGAYVRNSQVLPRFSDSDPGDAEPIGLGVKGASVTVDRIRVLRDIYYTQSYLRNGPLGMDCDYSVRNLPNGDGEFVELRPDTLHEILQSPELWEDQSGTALFESLYGPNKSFPLSETQYFPLGDNSPASQDARTWPSPAYVESNLMIGKALFVYWPHSWNRPVPYLPNFKRMTFIR